ncbi:MAG: helix-hairpin-helix domain-containing protein [Chloroflexota bacterium]|nr:helix-hairpin-helix domain-containing protein [Chloroflexota bacterium]
MSGPASPPSNSRIGALLREYADLLELRGESPFRTAAYRRAADSLAALDRPAAELNPAELQAVEGIGKGISTTIGEIVARGTFGPLEELRAIIPPSVIRFTDLPGVGVKTAAKLYEELGVTTLDELREAAAAGRIGKTKGLGPRVERIVRDGLQQLEQTSAFSGRHSIGAALPLGLLLRQLLRARLRAKGAVTAVELVGSARRFAETVRDINLLAGAGDPAPVLDTFAALPPVGEVLERDEQSLRVALDAGLTARLVVAPPARFGTELARWTGSPAHLDELRALARDRGIADPFAGDFADEESFYASLGLPPIAPELREGRGEVAAVREGRLPRLVALGHLRGDLHAHSTWSDGAASIAEMARAAVARGYAYLSITDHTQSLGIANGLDERRIRAQWREIERLNAELAPFRLLKSAEVEIRRNGGLDLPDEVLAGMDLVVASLHTGLRGDRATVTGRLLRAMRNPHVDIIAHPSGRLVGGRAGADYDWDAVFAAAAETRTALEINATTERLDLRDHHARRALDRGVALTIGSDAHSPDGFDTLVYGVAVARRAGAGADDILNTRSLDDLLAWARER